MHSWNFWACPKLHAISPRGLNLNQDFAADKCITSRIVPSVSCCPTSRRANNPKSTIPLNSATGLESYECNYHDPNIAKFRVIGLFGDGCSQWIQEETLPSQICAKWT